MCSFFFFSDRPQESGENIINCHPVEGSPKKPKNLIAMEAESLKQRHQKFTVNHCHVNR
jgi:endoplasmic reticulum lectin 1